MTSGNNEDLASDFLDSVINYPIFPMRSDDSSRLIWNISAQEISFSGQWQNYCVSFIDIVSSTKIAARMSSDRVANYYGIFLNSVATIIQNFGGRIVKNVGDSLVYYFPETANAENFTAFKDAVDCSLTIIDAHNILNAQLQSEQLPPLDYRISADYGRVEIAKTGTSQADDLFGSTMNRCAKMNAMAKPNGLVIGTDLYEKLTQASCVGDYELQVVGEYALEPGQSYPVYSLSSRNKRSITNPFNMRPSSSWKR